MNGATESFISTNGVELRVYEAGPKGNPVVLCHGFPELAYSWRHQIQPLADAGFHVIAPDQRGYGGSSRPTKVEDYRIEEAHDDLLGLLDHHGYDAAHFVGHDWGSLVVWELALRHPERVASVTGVSVPFMKLPIPPTQLFKLASNNGETFNYILYFQEVGPGERELEADPHRSMRLIMRGVAGDANPIETYAPLPAVGTGFLDMFSESQDPLPRWLTSEDIQVFAHNFEASGFFGPLSWYRNIDHNWETSRDLDPARVSMPSFFIAGDRDGAAVAFDPGGKVMKSLLPDLRGMVMLPGVGHWTPQEDPEGFNRALLGFLGSLS